MTGQVELARHFRAKASMRVEVADHEAAAVEEHQRRAGGPVGTGIEQPQRDRPGGPGSRHVAHHRKLADGQVGGVLARDIDGTRGGRGQLVRLGAGAGH